MINGTNHDTFRYFIGEYHAAINSAGYANFLAGFFGPLLGQLLHVAYPLADYQDNPDLAFATLMTDGYYSCSARYTDHNLSQYVPTYAYEFADENAPPILPPAGYTFGFPQGAEYFSEAQYLFDLSAAGQPTVPFMASQQSLSNAMIRYWTGFATNGDPNQTGLPVWPRYEPPAPGSFLSLVPPSPVVVSDAAFGADHKCTNSALPPPFTGIWDYLIFSVQLNG